MIIIGLLRWLSWEGPRGQVPRPECNPWNPYGGRKELTLTSCHQTSARSRTLCGMSQHLLWHLQFIKHMDAVFKALLGFRLQVHCSLYLSLCHFSTERRGQSAPSLHLLPLPLSFPSRSRVGSRDGWEGCLIHINVSLQTGSHRAGFRDGHLSNRNIVLDSITWE